LFRARVGENGTDKTAGESDQPNGAGLIANTRFERFEQGVTPTWPWRRKVRSCGDSLVGCPTAVSRGRQ